MKPISMILSLLPLALMSGVAGAQELTAKNLYFTRDTISIHYGTSSRCAVTTEVLKELSIPGQIEFTTGDCTPLMVGFASKDRSVLTVSVNDSFIQASTQTIVLPSYDFGDVFQQDVNSLKTICGKVAMDLMNITLEGASLNEVQFKLKPLESVSAINVAGCSVDGSHVVLRLKATVRTAE